MYRKYYSYNDMPKPIKPPPPTPAPKIVPQKTEHGKDIAVQHKGKSFLRGIENDDLILAAVLLVLLMDECDDWLLLAVIAGLLFFNK